MKISRAIAVLFCVLACMTSARGDLLIALTPSTLYGPRGTEIVFSGTLTNTSATEKLYLNDIHANLTGAAATYLTLEPNAFFSNVPGILSPNESYSNSEIFRVLLSDTTPSGDYSGTIVISGGTDIFASGDLVSAGFVVSSPGKISSIARMANGHILLQCFGAQNADNTIEASPDLVTPFTTLVTLPADAQGAFQYEDTNPGTSKFYRLTFPSDSGASSPSTRDFRGSKPWSHRHR
jgi:hypothetical protein